MPPILTWSRLPAALRDHLIERMRDLRLIAGPPGAAALDAALAVSSPPM